MAVKIEVLCLILYKICTEISEDSQDAVKLVCYG